MNELEGIKDYEYIYNIVPWLDEVQIVEFSKYQFSINKNKKKGGMERLPYNWNTEKMCHSIP